jgi:hypothetical protein
MILDPLGLYPPAMLFLLGNGDIDSTFTPQRERTRAFGRTNVVVSTAAAVSNSGFVENT